MRAFLLIIIGVSIFFLNTANQSNNCTGLDGNSLSGKALIEQLEKTKFEMKQEMRTFNLFGLKEAKFYSCDGETGYMVVEKNSKTEVFRNVPLKVWKEFRLAKSSDAYFVDNIERHTGYQTYNAETALY
jgi:hypothetical protein